MVKGDETTDCHSLEDGLSCDVDPDTDRIQLIPMREPSLFGVHEYKTRAYNEGIRNCGVLCFTFMAMFL